MENTKTERKGNNRLQICMLLLFGVVVFIMVTFIDYSVNENMEKEQLVTLETVSGKVASNMEDYFEGQWNHLDYIENTLHLEQYAAQEDIFDSLRRINLTYGLDKTDSQLILIDENGYYHTCKAGKVAQWSDYINSAGKLSDGRELIVNNLAELSGHLEQYICFMQKLKEPITAADGSSFTHIVLAIDERVFEIDLSMGEFGTISDAFVINGNGHKINSQIGTSDLSKAYNILSALKKAEFMLGDSYQNMYSQIRKRQSGSSLLRYKGKEYFVAHHALGLEDWNVMFLVGREQMIDRITPFVYWMLTVILAGFVVLFVIVVGMIYINRKMEMEREHMLNEQLQRSVDIANQANRAKSDFLSRMSHDIRTPLNGIIGMTAIAEKTLDDQASVESCLKKISSASSHLLELVNDVLDISQIESGRMEVRNAPVDLKELLNQLSDINESRISARSLMYQTDMSALSHPYVIADKTILNQILLNIIGNAVKYTEDQGSIRCTVYDCPADGKAAEYHFIIQDTGIGMTQEYVKHIFEQFSQEENGARTKYEGSGLGMAITKEMVDLLGGEIRVESEKGVGSTFEVILNFMICEAGEIQAEESRQKERIIERHYHVLLVEDNEINREIAEFLLCDAGIMCTPAEDGVQAVQMFEQSKPGEYDCILMDILMPNMDGHEAAEKIRAMERPDAGTIPIFAMTASAYEEDREKSFAAGMNAHLTKPIVLDEVVEALQKWCAKE